MAMNKPELPACLAPPLTVEKLAEYRELAIKCKDEVITDEMLKLVKMVEVFNETPTSEEEPTLIKIRAAKINGQVRESLAKIPLAADEVKRIWDVVPYAHELKALAELFEGIPNSPTWKPLRDAAHHLLWFATELYNDREPMTFDKV